MILAFLEPAIIFNRFVNQADESFANFAVIQTGE
jgi:hypothetical protein